MLVRNRLSAKAVVVLALSLTAAACGQNANVKKPGASGALAGQVGSTNNPSTDKRNDKPVADNAVTPPGTVISATPAPETPESPATNSSTPAAPAAPVASQPSAPAAPTTPVATQPAAPTVPAVTTPVTAPVATQPEAPAAAPAPAIVAGPAGAVGPQGLAGRDGCGLEQKTLESIAVPMDDGDYQTENLPYLSTARHKIALKQIGGSNHVTAAGVPYVRDAQVLFKFPVHMSPKDAIHHVSNAYIQLSVVKLSADGFPDTEWLCFMDQKICSGKVYEIEEKSWQKNINMSFWGNLKGDMHDVYVSQLKGNLVGRLKGQKLWASDAFTVKLEDMIKGSSYADTLSFLYDGVDASSKMDREIHVVVADDTLVKSAKLIVQYEEDTCKTNALEAGSR